MGRRRRRQLILYHAWGGGLGHAVRTLSLARALMRLVGGRHVVNVNTPFAAALHEPGIELVKMLPIPLVDEFRPTLFVVDTFPRGVTGELVRLLEGWSACPRVLIARQLPEDYVQRYRLRTWVARHFDLVLCPGEPTPFAGVPCDPFLIRERDELPARTNEWPLIVGSGTPDACLAWVERARMMAGARLALPPGTMPEVEAIRHFPLIEVLPRATRVIGAAGYNLAYECAFVGVQAALEAQPRQYDAQHTRLTLKGPIVNGAQTAAEEVRKLLGQ